MTSNPQFSPIYRLDKGTLWEIFSINSFESKNQNENVTNVSNGLDLAPLNIARRSSQVCHAWRETLLESPSIWGRCVDLSVLKGVQDQWRDTVIQRTGQSPLTVTGSITPPLETSFSAFLDDLFDIQWLRMTKIQLVFHGSQVLDNPRVWQALGTPTDNLKMFSIKVASLRAHIPSNIVQGFQLFSNHAPSLVRFHFQSTQADDTPGLNITAPMVFTNNLRNLIISRPNQLKDIELLMACAQMKSLQNLEIEVVVFAMTDLTQSQSLRPQMPRLARISISTFGSTNLGIYPAFLDLISPNPTCALILSHTIPARYDPFTTTILGHMERVIERYTQSFLGHYETQPHDLIRNVTLTISRRKLRFSSYGPPGNAPWFQLKIWRRFTRRRGLTLNLPNETVHQLVTMISNIPIPKTVDRLRFAFRPETSTPDMNLLVPLAHLWGSLTSITHLVATPSILSYYGEISISETAFPRLDCISLQKASTRHNGGVKKDQIIPFLRHQLKVAVLKVLYLTPSRSPYGDLTFLNELEGLTVRWIFVSDDVNEERSYVCGTGGGEELLMDQT